MKPAAADTGPTVTSSVAVCAENLLTIRNLAVIFEKPTLDEGVPIDVVKR